MIFFREHARLPTKKKSGLSWQTGLITLIWDKWLESWKMRNEDVKIWQAKQQREVKHQLMEIYAMKNQMEPSARSLLCQDI
jgi:hypothetical protein